MIKYFYIMVYQLIVMFVFYCIYKRYWKDKTDKRISGRESYSFYISNIVFLGISIIVLCPALLFYKYLEEKRMYYFNSFPIESGILPIFIIIFTNIIIKVIYKILLVIVNKYSLRFKLRYLGTDTRMWIYIAVSFLLISIDISDITKRQLGVMGITIITGKFLWVDDNIINMKKSLKKFFSLPYWICILYINIFSSCFFNLITKDNFVIYWVLLCVSILIYSIIIYFICFKSEVFNILNETYIEYMREIISILKEVNSEWKDDVANVIHKKI